MNIIYVRINQIAKVRDVPAYAVDAEVLRATWHEPMETAVLDTLADAVTITESRAREGYQLCVGVAAGHIYANVSVEQMEVIAESFVFKFINGDLDDETQ